MTEHSTMHTSVTHPPRPKPIKNKSTKFTQKEVELSETPLFFPEGFETLFLAIYFVSLPYIAGLLFQFFYIADAKIELFLSLNEQSYFLLTWAIGYEIIASIIILFIIKMAIGFANESRKPGIKEFHRP